MNYFWWAYSRYKKSIRKRGSKFTIRKFNYGSNLIFKSSICNWLTKKRLIPNNNHIEIIKAIPTENSKTANYN